MTLLFQTYRPLRPSNVSKIYPIQSNPLFRGLGTRLATYVKIILRLHAFDSYRAELIVVYYIQQEKNHPQTGSMNLEEL